MTIQKHAYARAGLLGNPSDVYFGKIIAMSVRNFSARVSLAPSAKLKIQPHSGDRDIYEDKDEFCASIEQFHYYGGVRLIKAAMKVFYDYCAQNNLRLHERNFTVRYSTSIPRQVGLAGSSAIVTAAIRALRCFYDVAIPPEILPNIILSAETEQLGINAGLMDRVIQAYEGCMYMDLSRELLETRGHGEYRRMEVSLLPPLYLAYKTELSECSALPHSDMKDRYERGDEKTVSTLGRIAQLADLGVEALLERDYATLAALMNENFDLRCNVMNVSERNKEVVSVARGCGASAKFTGSGGAIIGIYEDEKMLRTLRRDLGALNVRVVKPFVG